MDTFQPEANSAPTVASPLIDTPTPTPWQGPAVICALTDQGWRVNAETGSFVARLAASCLLQPEVGDTVWCCGSAPDGETPRYWVIHVLERARAQGARIELPASATLGCSDSQLTVDTRSLELRTGRLALLFEQASAIGAVWEAVVGAVQVTGQTLRSVYDRVTHTAQHHQRFTAGSDLVQAQTLDLRAQALANVQAEHVIVQGERLIKSRAAQIHMG